MGTTAGQARARTGPVFLLILVLAAALGGCGSGGGDEGKGGSSASGDTLLGDAQGQPERPPAADSQPKFDASYTPVGPVGAYWRYDTFDGLDGLGQKLFSSITTVSASDGKQAVLTITAGPITTLKTSALNADGLYELRQPEGLSTAPEFAAPIPVYLFSMAPGQQRLIERSASLDVNGDQQPDTVRYNFVQKFEGFEPVSVGGLNYTAAHFQNAYNDIRSLTGATSTQAVLIEDTWLVANLGLVRATRSAYRMEGASLIPGAAVSDVLTATGVGGP